LCAEIRATASRLRAVSRSLEAPDRVRVRDRLPIPSPRLRHLRGGRWPSRATGVRAP